MYDPLCLCASAPGSALHGPNAAVISLAHAHCSRSFAINYNKLSRNEYQNCASLFLCTRRSLTVSTGWHDPGNMPGGKGKWEGGVETHSKSWPRFVVVQVLIWIHPVVELIQLLLFRERISHLKLASVSLGRCHSNCIIQPSTELGVLDICVRVRLIPTVTMVPI